MIIERSFISVETSLRVASIGLSTRFPASAFSPKKRAEPSASSSSSYDGETAPEWSETVERGEGGRKRNGSSVVANASRRVVHALRGLAISDHLRILRPNDGPHQHEITPLVRGRGGGGGEDRPRRPSRENRVERCGVLRLSVLDRRKPRDRLSRGPTLTSTLR